VRKRRVFKRRTTRRRGLRRVGRFRRHVSTRVFAKFCLEGSSTVTGGTPVATANAISLTDMGGSGGTASITNYANVYQEYRIRKIKWNFYPRGVSNPFTWADDAPHGGTAVTAIDYNDVTSPTNFQQLARSANSRIHSLNRPFSRYFTPSVIDTIASGTGTSTTNSRVLFGPWIKTNALGVEHYGLKTFFRAPGATTAKYHIDYVVTTYVEFRYPQ